MTVRVLRAAALAGAIIVAPLAASADPTAKIDGNTPLSTTAIISQPMATAQGASATGAPAGQIAQAKPIGETEKPLSKPGLPTGFSYTLDGSIAYPMGDIGYNAKFPGGVDGVLSYGFNSHTRVTAGYYTFQEYPVGFNTGSVPLYLQGVSPAIGSVDLSKSGPDTTTRNTIIVAGLQNLIQIGKIPLIITPTYIARKATIGGGSDVALAEINGFPQLVHTRSFEEKLIAFTLPFLSTPKMFGTYTAAPQWLMNTNGANQTNHPQIFQLVYLEYRANKDTTFFFQPSILKDYTPLDYYPQNIPTLLYGITHKLGKPFFIEAVVSSGGPTNPVDKNRLGILGVTLQGTPVPPTASPITATTFGGLHAAQIQIMLGIGQPSVIPL